jgi:Beta-lactamase enzyme family
MGDGRSIAPGRLSAGGLAKSLTAVVLLSVLVGVVSQTVSTVSPAVAKPTTDPKGSCTASSLPAQVAGRRNPLRGVCAYLAGRDGVVQVALFNRSNGTTYLLSNGDDTQYTASIVKADILALWLHNYQMSGTKIPDAIPYSIKYLMQLMIEMSDNAATTGLFYFAGGCSALTGLNDLIPLSHTTVGCETPSYYGWGNTTTTAADQVDLMKIYAYGGRDDVIGSDARNYGLQLMENVDPTERWGISCGPWGTKCDPPDYAPRKPDVTVALKNGWKTLPTCTKPIKDCPWQVNSTGWVAGEGRNYALTVLTTDDPVGSGDTYGFTYGIDTIQGVSKLIWANLG